MSRRSSRPAALAVSVALAGAVSAATLPPLSQNKYINDRLFSGIVGNIIRKECPTISPRLARALMEAQALKAHALREGYTEAEIEAFIDSDADRRRLKDAARRWLAEQGARQGDPQSYCTIGVKEIERGSLTGRLLRAD